MTEEDIEGEMDIDRIMNELNGNKTIEIISYISYLKKEFPKTYLKFQLKYPEIGVIKT